MTTMNNEDPADPSVHERQDAYRCIAPACKPLGCSDCNCAVPADVYAALGRAFAEAERERWERALKQTWQAIDPLKPAGQPGSYARGYDNGFAAALEVLRCWVLGTFKPDMLPECGDELFAEADEPRDAWAKLQAELSTLRQHLAEAVRERDALRSVVQSALNNNGGPIDADSTLDGKSYVMVLREDFDAIDAASRVAGT